MERSKKMCKNYSLDSRIIRHLTFPKALSVVYVNCLDLDLGVTTNRIRTRDTGFCKILL